LVGYRFDTYPEFSYRLSMVNSAKLDFRYTEFVYWDFSDVRSNK
jgi:hypothetical protein